MASDYPEGFYGLRVKALGLVAKLLGVKFKVNGFPFGSRLTQPHEQNLRVGAAMGAQRSTETF